VNPENWPLDRVKPYAANPRVNRAIVDQLAASIREFGWQQPLVVDRDDVLVIGHARLQAARALGLDEVPVVVCDLPAEKVRALRIADNRTREYAEWDLELLAEELRGVPEDLLAIVGFSPADDLLQQGWKPPAKTPLPGREGGTALTFTAEQWARVVPALDKARELDQSMSAARALELICADALA